MQAVGGHRTRDLQIAGDELFVGAVPAADLPRRQPPGFLWLLRIARKVVVCTHQEAMFVNIQIVRAISRDRVRFYRNRDWNGYVGMVGMDNISNCREVKRFEHSGISSKGEVDVKGGHGIFLSK